jgi:hypothetical protein
MQTSIQGSMGSARDAVMVSALPPWVDRKTCVISEPPGSVRASFYCCCSVQKVKRTVKVGSSPNESATKLADSVKRGHDRENQGHSFPYYIGQTVDAGDGSCIIKQCTERESINGTSFTRGDYVIAVRW